MRRPLASPLCALLPVFAVACGGPQTPDTAGTAPTSSAIVVPSVSASATAATAPSGPPICEGAACNRPRLISAHGGSYGAAACAILAGQVACWGDVDYSALPPKTNAPWLTPRFIPGVQNAASVLVSRSTSCAALADGKVTCWPRGVAVDVPFRSKVTQIAAGGSSGTDLYAVLDNGEIQGVTISSMSSPKPLETPALRDVTTISAANGHACAVHRSGEVSCWGHPVDILGAGLDNGNTTEARREEVATKSIKVTGLADAVAVSVSEYHTCALRRTKQVVCWGANGKKQLGLERSITDQPTPAPVPVLADVVEVTTGYQHTCARRESGKVACWGDNEKGALGAASADSGEGPVDARGVLDAVAVAAGADFTCAIRASGDISCWGASSRGRLGNGKMSEITRPAPVAGVSGATRVVAGKGYSCSLDTKGRVFCWGLVRDSAKKPPERGLPKEMTELENIKSLAKSDRGICVVDAAGESSCLELDGSAPKSLASLGKVQSIIGGTYSGGAMVLPSGQVSLFGEIIDPVKQAGAPASRTVTGLSDVVALTRTSTSDGMDRVCVVRKSGKIGCVVFNQFALFQYKNPDPVPVVFEVPGITDAVAIASDSTQICAVHKTGEVDCFSPTDLPRPGAKGAATTKIELRRIKNLNDAVQIAAGGSVCVLRKAGTLACWRDNRSGELGTGDLEYKWDPEPVQGLTDVVAFDIDNEHTCAAKKSGEVLCWGSNELDQAGQIEPAYHFEAVAAGKPVKD